MYNYKKNFLRTNQYPIIYGLIEYAIICVQMAAHFVTSHHGSHRDAVWLACNCIHSCHIS